MERNRRLSCTRRVGKRAYTVGGCGHNAMCHLRRALCRCASSRADQLLTDRFFLRPAHRHFVCVANKPRVCFHVCHTGCSRTKAAGYFFVGERANNAFAWLTKYQHRSGVCMRWKIYHPSVTVDYAPEYVRCTLPKQTQHTRTLFIHICVRAI